MNLASKPAATRLAHRTMLDLRNRHGDRVECLDGSVWITQDGDPRDVVLDAGESFTLDRAGTALIYALADARVVVQRPSVPTVMASTSHLQRLLPSTVAPRNAT